MNKISACIFPDTLPDESLLFPLVQVFAELVYMQAVEHEPCNKEHSSLFIEQLLQQGLLQLITPVPLGKQRERFLALMEDMKRRGGDYTNQLSMLTLAGLTRRQEEETKNTILTSLLHSGNIENRKEEEDLLLWQSRLMLKLGEFFDADQADLEKALQNITNRQDDLLSELREDTDNPFPLPAGSLNLNSKAEGILPHRLKAWSRLYFQGSAPTQPQFFITFHHAVIDTLQEVFEKNHQQSARFITSVELPVAQKPTLPDSPTSNLLLPQCPGLQRALTALTTTNAFPSSLGEDWGQLFTESKEQWSHLLDSRYPPEQYDRCTLDLFLFPAISVQQLFAESFIGNRLSAALKDQPTSPGALIGFLNREGRLS